MTATWRIEEGPEWTDDGVRVFPTTLYQGDRNVITTHNERDREALRELVAQAAIGAAATPSVDSLLAQLRQRGLRAIGAQDAEVGFPAYLPPGYWVDMQTDSGHASFIAPTLREACEAALAAGSLSEGQEGQ